MYMNIIIIIFGCFLVGEGGGSKKDMCVLFFWRYRLQAEKTIKTIENNIKMYLKNNVKMYRNDVFYIIFIHVRKFL